MTMDFASSSDVGTADVSNTETKRDSKTIDARAFNVVTDPSRDALLTDFGKDTLQDRYLLPGESYQDLFARVASAYADDQDHAQRVYDYISKLWFMPATPVLSNGGTGRGLPISCYLNSVSDSLNGIVDTWNENVWLASKGGGIGTYWGAVRGIGEPVGLNGKTSGIIPFVRVMDSLTLAISQGSLRRGSAACYLDVSHPEIEEFLEIRKPSGDFNRKALNLHHGVLITDEFMEAVEKDGEYEWVWSAQHAWQAAEVIKALQHPDVAAELSRVRVEEQDVASGALTQRQVVAPGEPEVLGDGLRGIRFFRVRLGVGAFMSRRPSAVVSDSDFEIPLLSMAGKLFVLVGTRCCADMDMLAAVFLSFPFLPIAP